MYKDHEAITPPGDVNASIWRYLDLGKYLSMLDSGALHFARADRLGDPFEGSMPRPNYEARREQFEGLDLPSEVLDSMPAQWESVRLIMFINSWHLAEHESAAMWRFYAESDRGIAMRSTFARLTRAFDDWRQPVYAGKVSYADYERASISMENAFHQFMTKRLSFQYERELRAITISIPPNTSIPSIDRSTWQKVLPVSVDLQSLITGVYVAPGAPSWFAEVVRSLSDRYGLDVPVQHSQLDADPLF